ncbi:hypothetical protein C6503_12165 [Candidatus Poribacteria bacterium]|nr:MAG: hypothetical protein C6503_12165 [Candidatus Poribacteria bacterium]
MLMKMSQYKSGTVFTIAICLSSILLAILVAYACDLDALKKSMDDAYSAYNAAESDLATLRTMEPPMYEYSAYLFWYSLLVELEFKLEEKRSAYYEAVANYEACANPPERYTYTDYYGNVYEFSDKDSYNQFLRNRGHSTI